MGLEQLILAIRKASAALPTTAVPGTPLFAAHQLLARTLGDLVQLQYEQEHSLRTPSKG